jgi:hypothetical protein
MGFGFQVVTDFPTKKKKSKKINNFFKISNFIFQNLPVVSVPGRSQFSYKKNEKLKKNYFF